MRRKSILLTLMFLFCCLFLSAEDELPIVLKIDLIEDSSFSTTLPLSKLLLGIEMAKGIHFKLLFKNAVLRAGMLQPGLNIVNVPAGQLFEASGVYEYQIEFKDENRIFTKVIEIDIQLDRDLDTMEKNINLKDVIYDLSLFVGDKLVAFNQQKHYAKFPVKIVIPDLPLDHKPYDPNWKEDPMANSFSILHAVALAYMAGKEIKNLISPPQKNYTYTRKKVIIHTFNRKLPSGEEQEVNIVIRLTSKDDQPL